MGALLADEPLPILEGIGLMAASIGLILASASRMRSRRSGSQVAQFFWRDVSQAGYVWAGATIVVLFGGLGNVEGLRVPIWLLLSVISGLASLAIARLRWVQRASAQAQTSPGDSSLPERPRLVSTSWEVALLGGGVGGLVVYGVSLSHTWGHPIHWLVVGVGMAVGYAVGLVIATPRYTVRRGS